MSFNYGEAGADGVQGAQSGYQVGGPWGAVAGGVIGTAVGGLEFGGKPGMPTDNPLIQMGEGDWNWYKNNIIPAQQKAMQSTFGPQAYSQAVNTATGDVNAQFAGANSSFERRSAGLGVNPNPAQRAAFSKSTALSKGLYMAGAQNAARQGVTARQSQLSGV